VTAPAEAVERTDWAAVAAALDEAGAATTGTLLDSDTCAALAAAYDDDARFRSRVVMARHGFGQGEYRYFAYPLPDPVAALRAALYARLVPIANDWERRLGRAGDFPPSHAEYLARCHAAGQARPTPLLLRYGPGDYNCLHQDLYGPLVFPLQVVILLSDPAAFDGGAFVVTEQRPRAQSRAEVLTPARGQGVVFAVNQRPRQGARGAYRVAHRHGVSRVRAGTRQTLGIIFHDAA
jgi:hypothetical protein